MTETPDEAQRIVDDLEQRILGEKHDQRRDDDEGEQTGKQIDPSETTADDGGHTNDEPPV